jgi:hypothetical protein
MASRLAIDWPDRGRVGELQTNSKQAQLNDGGVDSPAFGQNP